RRWASRTTTTSATAGRCCARLATSSELAPTTGAVTSTGPRSPSTQARRRQHTGGWVGRKPLALADTRSGETMTIGFNSGSRSIQDRFDTQALSDRIDELLVSGTISEHDR